MAPLPPDGTPRFKFNYFVSVVPHSFQVRSHASPSAIGALVDDFMTALSPALFGLEIATVDFAADGSDIFIPVTTGIEGNTYGSGEGSVLQRPWFYGFQGRGATGRKWHLDVFGAVSLATNFRWSPGESEAVDNAVAILQTFGSSLVDIADAEVTVYTYVNAGDNAHFQRKAR
jgi:hypothetical protein